MKKLKKLCTDILFPIYCFNCRQEGHWLCWDKNLDYSYNNPAMRRAIHAFKYQFVKELSRPLGKLFLEKIENCKLKIENFDYIVPVPLHARRLRWRGFNQAELLAKEIDKDKVVNALIKIKPTKPQMKLKEAQRKVNLYDAFVCVQNIEDKKILLVDDIKTTGSTLKECKKVLLAAGAKKVIALTLLET